MPRWRVGEGGVRVLTARGAYSLPPGAVLDELPHRYEGTLEVIAWDEHHDEQAKRVARYADKAVHVAEDKAL